MEISSKGSYNTRTRGPSFNLVLLSRPRVKWGFFCYGMCLVTIMPLIGTWMMGIDLGLNMCFLAFMIVLFTAYRVLIWRGRTCEVPPRLDARRFRSQNRTIAILYLRGTAWWLLMFALALTYAEYFSTFQGAAESAFGKGIMLMGCECRRAVRRSECCPQFQIQSRPRRMSV